MDDFSKSPLLSVLSVSLGDSVLFPRCRLCHTHKGSDILPLCCWDPVVGSGVVDMEDALEFRLTLFDVLMLLGL